VSSSFSLRLFALGSVVVALLSGHTVNAGDEQQTAASRVAEDQDGEPIHIRVLWGIGGAARETLVRQITLFNDMQQEIVVELIQANGYGDAKDRFREGIAARDPFDAAIVEVHSVSGLAAENLLEPLDHIVAADTTFQLQDLVPATMLSLRHEQQLFAIPINRSTPVLYYNKDRFEEAGLDGPPETWQQLREFARQLTPANSDQYGFLASNYPWLFCSLVWGAGGELVTDDKASFAAHAAKPLQLWADMIHRDKTARFGDNGDSLNEFIAGRAAMSLGTSANAAICDSACTFDFGIAFLPRFDGCQNGVPTGGGAAVMARDLPTDRQAAVWVFLSFVTSTEHAAEMSERTGYVPVRESSRILLTTGQFYLTQPEYSVAVEQLQFAREFPSDPRWGSGWGIFGGAMTSILQDDAPVLETLTTAERTMNELLQQ